MASNSITYLICAFILSAITQFLLIKIAHKNDLFIDDHESDLPQKFHDEPTPRVGGLGIFLACLFMAVSGKIGLFILIASIPSFLAGLFEDIYTNISPLKRLLIMLVSAILSVTLLDAVICDYGLFTTPYILGLIISFIAVLGLINGTNMIDGYNGLLSGVCLIIFLSFSLISYRIEDKDMLTINMTLFASILGFVVFNYPKGKIFLGDGGAYFLGFCMAVISILLFKNNFAKGISPFFVLVCISYPVMEVIFSFTRKYFYLKTSPFQPDGNHLHMLINRNLVSNNNPRTIFVILPIILIFNLLAIYFYSNQNVLILLTIIFILFYLISYKLLINYQKRKELKANIDIFQ